MKKCSLLAAILLSTWNAFGAGFSLYEVSTRTTSMGGATIGRAGDASAVYSNPAAITQLPGVNLLGTMTLIRPSGDINIPSSGNPRGVGGGTVARPTIFTVPAGFMTWQFDDRVWFGFGNYTEYGLGTDYNPGWVGRYAADYSELESMTFSPVIALKLTDDLSIAAGLRVMYGTFAHRRTLGTYLYTPTGTNLGWVKLDMAGLSYGYLLGLNYKVTDDLYVGLTYHSRLDFSADGDSESLFSMGGATVQTDFNAEADLTLPSSIVGGVNYMITDQWEVGASVTWTEWSTFDELTITSQKLMYPGGAQRLSEEKNWKNVFRFGIGTEYVINDKWAIQAGYVYDRAPQDKYYADFLMPPGHRHMLSVGVSYALTDNCSLFAGYAYLRMLEANGQAVIDSATHMRSYFECHETQSHFLSLSISYKF